MREYVDIFRRKKNFWRITFVTWWFGRILSSKSVLTEEKKVEIFSNSPTPGLRSSAGHLSFGLGAGDRGAIRGFSFFSSLLEGIRAQIPGNFGFPEEFAHRGKTRIPFRSGISRSETNFFPNGDHGGVQLGFGWEPDHQRRNQKK